MKRKISFFIGIIIGLIVRLTTKLYNKSFWYFKNEELYKGLRKTAAFPGLIKADFLMKGEKLDYLKKKNDSKEIDRELKKVVYTCVTGGYDDVAPVFFKPSDCDFLLYTDDPNCKVEGWETVLLPQGLINNTILLSRYPKLLPHRLLKDYDYSIYLDGSYDLIGDISELFEYMNEKPLAFFRHSDGRTTLNEEAEAIILSEKADPLLVRKQLETYQNNGFQDNIGLFEAGILVRAHNDLWVIEAMEQWWHEIKTHTQRDQLSLPYVLWKTGLDFHVIKGNNRKSELFVRRGHN